MVDDTDEFGTTRRGLLTAAAGFAGATLISPSSADAGDDPDALIGQLTGKTATASDRIRLVMPRVFPNGYTVPLTVTIDSPMTESDHVRQVQVLAPRNPLVLVATFHFVPGRSEPRVSTRIRLAVPQDVIAIAEMSNGELMMASTWVEVATDGCT